MEFTCQEILNYLKANMDAVALDSKIDTKWKDEATNAYNEEAKKIIVSAEAYMLWRYSKW